LVVEVRATQYELFGLMDEQVLLEEVVDIPAYMKLVVYFLLIAQNY
jgi:hypothetical protein